MLKDGEQSTNRAAVGRRGLLAVLALVLVLVAPSAGAPARWPQLTQHLTGRLIADEGAILHETVRWGEDVTLGAGVVIGARARLGSWIVIGAGSVIGQDVVIGSGVVLGRGVTLGDGTRIGPDAMLSSGTTIGRAAVIGAGASIGEGVVIRSKARLPDSTSVPDHAIVSKDGHRPSYGSD